MAAKHIKTYTVFAIQIIPGRAVPHFRSYLTSGIHFCCQIKDLKSPKKVIVTLSSNKEITQFYICK